MKLILQAEKMLKNSKLIEFQEDYRKRRNVKGAYKMESTASLKGKKIEVILTLREGNNGVIYYDHKILEKENSNKPSTPTRTKKSCVADQPKRVSDCKNTKSKPKPKKNNGLGTPIVNPNSLAYKLANRQHKEVEFYTIPDKDISEFLGGIEKKQRESVVITVTGGQGSMKTRFAFRFMNALAKNYKVGHASIEEHPKSTLYWNKVAEYISNDALKNISNPEIRNVQQLDELIKANDVIIIDSFAKMQELEKGFEVDKDLRKKYDGKLFLVIFQQTSDGSMRGGTKSQFDADIVLFTEKFDDYTNNCVYADKNRYQNKTLCDLEYNIFHGKLKEINAEKDKQLNEEIANGLFTQKELIVGSV